MGKFSFEILDWGSFLFFDCLVLLGHTLEYIFYFFSCKAILGWRCDGGVKKKKKRELYFSLSTCSDKPSFHLEQGAHPGSKKKVTNGRRNEGGDRNDDEMKCDFMAILGYQCNVCIYVK